MFYLTIIAPFLLTIVNCSDLRLIASTRTSELSRYTSFSSAILLIIDVPKDSAFMSVQFSAEEEIYSLLGSK